jgi:type IV pilus biogenesis protein PilP
MRVNYLTAILMVAGPIAVAAPMAFADQPTASSQNPIPQCPATLADTPRLQCLANLDQVLQEELKVSKEQSDLAAQDGDADTSDAAQKISIPNVLSIYGFGGQPLSAVLAYSDDRSLTVHAGEQVPGGFYVKSVYADPATVVLTKDGATFVLLMGNGGASINTESAQSSGNAPLTFPPVPVPVRMSSAPQPVIGPTPPPSPTVTIPVRNGD